MFSIATIERWLETKAIIVISTFLVVAKFFVVTDNAEGSHWP